MLIFHKTNFAQNVTAMLIIVFLQDDN